ncbi:DUF2938 family protein [Paraburkholderia sp. SIMBA_030]|uniref:DUF2938 family protein n=1 Tax=Paraburkholderia sp. SIMBA_030 TaxID=3085773 RepID=UPI00397BE46F
MLPRVVAAPFFPMQPTMGAGIAASSTLRHSAAARFHSLVTHAIFGLGRYAAACVTSLLGTVQWRSFD